MSLDVPAIFRFHQPELAVLRTTLANAFRAMVGAVFVDQGLQSTQALVRKLLPIAGIGIQRKEAPK